MPARNPRLQITLTPEVMEIISTIAASSKQSRSKVAADVLTESAPVLRRIATTLSNLRRLNDEKADAIRRTIEGAQAEAEQVAATAMALLERIGTDAEAVAGGRELRSGRGGRRPAAPARRKPLPPHC